MNIVAEASQQPSHRGHCYIRAGSKGVFLCAIMKVMKTLPGDLCVLPDPVQTLISVVLMVLSGNVFWGLSMPDSDQPFVSRMWSTNFPTELLKSVVKIYNVTVTTRLMRGKESNTVVVVKMKSFLFLVLS